MEQQAETELAALGAEIDSIEEAPVPAGDALRAEYTVDVALPDGGTVPTHGVQYYVVDGRIGPTSSPSAARPTSAISPPR